MTNRNQTNNNSQFVNKLRFLLFFHAMVLTWFSSIVYAQNPLINWEAYRMAEKGKSLYVSRIIEYKPAPGQFINVPHIGTPEAAESIVGGVQGLVSLGGFGGYIVVGFDHTIMNDPDNPYGVDFTIVGNAVENSSEPGIVMVMADLNGDGLPNDGPWYELKGSSYDSASTVYRYTITYTNPHTTVATDIPWNDNQGNDGLLKKVADHTQPYYPSPDIFPYYPQDEMSFTGTLINLPMNADNPQYIQISSLPYGYADNLPFKGGSPPYFPDNPQTIGVLEGKGGNAFDIDWAVDENGNPVHLDGIDFIKIYTAVNVNAGWLGELSTEVCGIIDVAPTDVLSSHVLEGKQDVVMYPNPANEFLNIQFADSESVKRIEIWNIAGRLMYQLPKVNDQLLTIPVRDYPAGIYLICIYEGKHRNVKKIAILP